MFFLHEVHALSGNSGDAFSELVRTEYAPALGREADTRLAWCVRTMSGTASFPELITLTAVADSAALLRLAERTREGDLQDIGRALSGARKSVTRRLMATLNFTGFTVDLAAIPAAPEPITDSGALYIHDFVPPVAGQQRAYEVAMGDAYMKMLSMEGITTTMWAGLETLAGGGPYEENCMISGLAHGAGAAKMLNSDVTREFVQPGQWLYDGLALRDRWVSRLVRAVHWSPLQ